MSAGKASVLPAAEVLVVDEAHDLAGVARTVLGEQLSFTYGRTLARRLPRLPSGDTGHGMEALALDRALGVWAQDLHERLVALQTLAGAREAGSGGRQLLLGDERAWAGPVQAAALALARTCRGMHEELKREAIASARRGEDPPEPSLADATVWERQADALERHARVAMALATPLGGQPGEDPDAFVRMVEREGDGPRQRLLGRYVPVDVSTALKLYVWGRPPGIPARPVLACSATLATAARGPERFAFFRREAGAPSAATVGPDDPPVYELVVPSPFPYRRNGRIYVPPRGAISADRQRDAARFHDQLAAEELALVRASSGRAFLLFTSRVSLRAVHERLAPRLPAPHWRVFVQGQDSRQEVLAAFRDEAGAHRAPPVLFATRSYFQGVDVQGSGLALVCLDRLPFPSPGEPLYAARARQVGREVGDPLWGHWRHLTLPLMVQLTKQAAGRLIRSHTDRGVVAVLDRRLLEKSYGGGVLAALPPMGLTQSLDEITRFLRGPP
jgi:Rad3-related DNA helicase